MKRAFPIETFHLIICVAIFGEKILLPLFVGEPLCACWLIPTLLPNFAAIDVTVSEESACNRQRADKLKLEFEPYIRNHLGSANIGGRLDTSCPYFNSILLQPTTL